MSNYHTNSLKNADVFTVMGSVYAEVARYDSAIGADQADQADQAILRAMELIDFSQNLNTLNAAQKMEIDRFGSLLKDRAKLRENSNFDDYLMPFALAARMRQFK
ncbi:MAG: hypothetical protein AAB459_01195 [Patescibacteria group bacterium]|jgi:hypothetical protein